jgi:hypothetical protein
MTWQTITIPMTRLASEVTRIRALGGTITRYCPENDHCVVTYCSCR